MATVEITDANFDSEVLSSDQPVLIDFWAEWCGPCKAIAPVVDELSTEYEGRIKVGKVDVDKAPGIAGKYGIRSIPTLILFKSGEVAEKMVGAAPKARMTEVLDRVLEASGAS
jgi:thioredoxin 1